MFKLMATSRTTSPMNLHHLHQNVLVRSPADNSVLLFQNLTKSYCFSSLRKDDRQVRPRVSITGQHISEVHGVGSEAQNVVQNARLPQNYTAVCLLCSFVHQDSGRIHKESFEQATSIYKKNMKTTTSVEKNMITLRNWSHRPREISSSSDAAIVPNIPNAPARVNIVHVALKSPVGVALAPSMHERKFTVDTGLFYDIFDCWLDTLKPLTCETFCDEGSGPKDLQLGLFTKPSSSRKKYTIIAHMLWLCSSSRGCSRRHGCACDMISIHERTM